MLITFRVSLVAALNGSLTSLGGPSSPQADTKVYASRHDWRSRPEGGSGCRATVTVARDVGAGMPSRYHADGIWPSVVAMVESVTRGGWPASVK